LIADTGMLIVDANLPSGAIGSLCSMTNAPIVALAVSPAKAPRIVPHAARFALAFMNRGEMNALTGVPLGEPVTPATLARLSALGFRRAVISDGGGPVTVLDGDAAWRQPVGEAANPVDVTGAGDALAGATLTHWPDRPLSEAVRPGVAAAAATIGVTGPFRADLSMLDLDSDATTLPAAEPMAFDTPIASETP
jgi:sugar/nucleoside kinase (ribokinase family)